MEAAAILGVSLLAIVSGGYLHERYRDPYGPRRHAAYVGIGVAAVVGAAAALLVALGVLLRTFSN